MYYGGREQAVKLSPGLGLAVGVALGSESLRVGIFDSNGEMLHSHVADYEEMQIRSGPAAVGQRIAKAIEIVPREALANDKLVFGRTHFGDRPDGARADDRVLRLLGMSVAWSEAVARDQTMWNPPGKLWVTDQPVVEQLRRHFFPAIRKHVTLLNDANEAALAFNHTRERAHERSLRTNEYEYLIALRISGGVGCGMVRVPPHDDLKSAFVNSTMIEGTPGLAGEVGHVTAPFATLAEFEKIRRGNAKRNGREREKDEEKLEQLKPVRCGCGKVEHLESFASWYALESRLVESGVPMPGSGMGFRSDLTKTHDRAVIVAQEDIGRVLGAALEPVILMLNPRSVTLVGGLSTNHVVNGLNVQFGGVSGALGENLTLRR